MFGIGKVEALLVSIIVLVFAFEIWMLVECLNDKKLKTYEKVWWVVGMFLVHPFVAIAYFIVSRTRSTRKSRAKTKV